MDTNVKIGHPVQIVRNGHVVATGYFYGQTSPTQVAVRSSSDPSQIGLFNADDCSCGSEGESRLREEVTTVGKVHRMSDPLKDQPAPSTYIPVSNLEQATDPEPDPELVLVPVVPAIPIEHVKPEPAEPEQPAEQEVNIDTDGGDVVVEAPAPAPDTDGDDE